MRTILIIASVWLLTACADTGYRPQASTCNDNPAGMDCQVERYMNVP